MEPIFIVVIAFLTTGIIYAICYGIIKIILKIKSVDNKENTHRLETKIKESADEYHPSDRKKFKLST